ncbi:hypothetical protein DFJ73DRAFT_772316 [Zopfochytrium polystomum]|nr:hypothetical protein DFJ73DRAFT_772316 [Zopfochytrium polystomum]
MSGASDPLIEVAPGFYTIQTSFEVAKGIDVGTQMSLLKLSSGKYLVIDTVDPDTAVKAAIDKLTDGGKLIQAVVGSHPYHTVYFKKFQELYPDAEYWGTKRHLRVLPDVKWTGDISTALTRWSPDVSLRIPSGADFDDPQPESNHFSGLFCLHHASRTLHVDDTLVLAGPSVDATVRGILGIAAGEVGFHPTLGGVGGSSEAVVAEWEFENLVAAHRGVVKGGARALVKAALEKAGPTFERLEAERQAASA